MVEKTMEKTDKTTCILTVVVPGSSDRVMKVFPANGKSEKIWLDNARGLERWEEVKRFLYNHAVRGTRVPDPQPYCGDPYDLKTRTLSEEDIPVCKLEDGYVFEVFVEEVRAPSANPMSIGTAEGVNKRIDDLEGKLGAVTSALEKIVDKLDKSAAVKK